MKLVRKEEVKNPQLLTYFNHQLQILLQRNVVMVNIIMKIQKIIVNYIYAQVVKIDGNMNILMLQLFIVDIYAQHRQDHVINKNKNL
jgi:hypothetical protein